MVCAREEKEKKEFFYFDFINKLIIWAAFANNKHNNNKLKYRTKSNSLKDQKKKT